MWQECEQMAPQGEATRLPVAGPKGARMPHHSFPVIASIVVSAALTAGCEHNSSSADRSSSQTPLSPSAVASGSAASTGGGASTAATHGLPDCTVTMMDAAIPTRSTRRPLQESALARASVREASSLPASWRSLGSTALPVPGTSRRRIPPRRSARYLSR